MDGRTDKMMNHYKLMPLFFFLIISGNSVANDSLAELMQRMKSEAPVKIAYKETRILELMDQPWLGSGFMYSKQPDLMIKEQLKPNRLLMGVKGENLFYFDPAKNIRHQSEMNELDSISLSVAVFKALINADEKLLNKLYQVKFSSHPQRWVMTLTKKNDPDSSFNIIVSGLAEQRVDTLVVNKEDGDTSEFMLHEVTSIKSDTVVDKLYLELQGK